MKICSAPSTAANIAFLLIAISGALTLFPDSAHAQLYKWAGADGKINYSDTPPPPGAKQMGTKASGGESVSVPLPFDLAAAVAQNPVTLYTSPTCAPCDEGRNLLKTNGIPFSEKTVNTNDDLERLKQVGGATQLPLLVIRSTKFRGFEGTEWRTALTSAGYPETNKLPKNYTYPTPDPAAPKAPPVKKNTDSNDGLPKPTPASESGIRF